MTAGRDVDRVVVVHGSTDERTEEALMTAGLELAAEVGETTVWVRRSRLVSAVDPAPAATPRSMAEGPSRLLLTVPEAAAVLGVGRTTAYGLIASGELKAVHIGRAARVPITALQELVDHLRSSMPVSQSRGRVNSLGSAGASRPFAAAASQLPAAVRPAAS